VGFRAKKDINNRWWLFEVPKQKKNSAIPDVANRTDSEKKSHSREEGGEARHKGEKTRSSSRQTTGKRLWPPLKGVPLSSQKGKTWATRHWREWSNEAELGGVESKQQAMGLFQKKKGVKKQQGPVKHKFGGGKKRNLGTEKENRQGA